MTELHHSAHASISVRRFTNASLRRYASSVASPARGRPGPSDIRRRAPGFARALIRARLLPPAEDAPGSGRCRASQAPAFASPRHRPTGRWLLATFSADQPVVRDMDLGAGACMMKGHIIRDGKCDACVSSRSTSKGMTNSVDGD